MLVLSRRAEEKVVFPSLGITLQVIRIQGNLVRLGIEAPPEVPVWRAELAPNDAVSLPLSSKSALRTLLVDDDSEARELLAGLLGRNGCDCVTAEDGLAALDYLATHDRPDYVLLDMRMPRCDGPETLQRIRSEPRYAGLKVFAISGHTAAEERITIGPGGVDAWFTKPVNPRRLWEAMQPGQATERN